ncbi:hypothetical protein ACP4OV_020009 [Aristida adscensionis]
MPSPAPARQERLPAAALITYSRKRRRRPAASPDWASLSQDVVEQIGWRVLAGDLQDYVRFRAVCAHWAASTVRPQGRGVRDRRFHPRRWMMLPEGHGLYPGHPRLRGYARFFSLSTGAFVRARLRLLEDHVVLDSVDGLLLLHRDRDTAVRLLHPFTGDIAELPPLDSILPQMEPTVHYPTADDNLRRTFLRKVCAVVAVSAEGAIAVMLAFDSLQRVAYATPGDQRWTLSTWKLLPLMRRTSFQGKLYLMRFSYGSNNKRLVQIYQIDPLRPATATATDKQRSNSLPQPLPKMIAECPRDKMAYPISLAECNSQLLLVGYTDSSSRNLLVYRLSDLADKKIVPMASIGDHALFLDERCLCVSPGKGLPSISPNSIICIHTSLRRNSEWFEQYHLDTGIWTPASDGASVQRPPPNPCTLIHHIFTCCRREYWNKGIMFCRETKPKWSVKRNLRIGT